MIDENIKNHLGPHMSRSFPNTDCSKTLINKLLLFKPTYVYDHGKIKLCIKKCGVFEITRSLALFEIL